MSTNEIIATQEILIKIKPEVADVTLKVKAELMPSGAFKYGNGTCVVLTINNPLRERETVDCYDTRYTLGITKENGLRDWLVDWAESNYSQNAESITVVL